MSIDKELHDAMLGALDRAQEKYKELDERVENIEFDVARKGVQSKIKEIDAQSEPKVKNFHLKEFLESDSRKYEDFIEQKGLAYESSPAFSEAELNTTILEQAIENNAVLNALGSRATKNLEYRRTINVQRPATSLTAENVSFAAVDDTDAGTYDTIAGSFTKMYAAPRITTEVLNFSDASVEENILRLVSEEFSRVMQSECLHGDGTGSGTKADPQHLRGICNAAIDRSNSYLEALKPAATRARDVFAAVISGDANGIGADSAALEANLYALMLTVPERSQANAVWIMNQNTLGYIMQTLKGSDGHSLVNIEMIEENGVWVRRINLFGARIILNETMDDLGADTAPIVFGDIAAGYELLMPESATHSIIDPYSIPDTVLYYRDSYFGSTVADHEAIAVLVCKA